VGGISQTQVLVIIFRLVVEVSKRLRRKSQKISKFLPCVYTPIFFIVKVGAFDQSWFFFSLFS